VNLDETNFDRAVLSIVAAKPRPATCLDTDMQVKVAVCAQKHERPERVAPAFLFNNFRLSALYVELFRVQRRVALDQNIFSG